jgi:hypothetical protein
MKAVLRSVKHYLAANLLDGPRYASALKTSNRGGWLTLCNRGQRLSQSPDQRGVRVLNAPWTSALFYCEANPQVGMEVMKAAFAEWPIAFRDMPENPPASRPRVSFIIGHRGRARVPHLLTTLRSLAAQKNAAFECVLVEQSPESELLGVLPTWVRHLHTPPPYADMPYSRAWAFNRGAAEAHGDYLVFHDNDICVPELYAHEIVAVLDRGFDAARLQRFVFYLNDSHSQDLFESPTVALTHPPLEVIQNGEGQTLAVRRDNYFAVGGHDEAFLGWGGEDNELFDRLRTLRLHDCAYLPFLHLYHTPQPGKAAINSNTTYFDERMRVPSNQRIAELVLRGFGRHDGPVLLPTPQNNS